MAQSIQPHASHYHTGRYDNKRRLASYWHQLDECRKLGAKDVLIIGHGSGMSAAMLRHCGYRVLSIDIDSYLSPDMICDVRDLRDITCDVAICCQVLEHLPFADLHIALTELHRVSRQGVVLSLPDQRPYSKAIPALLNHRRILTLPFRRLIQKRLMDGHYWEIGVGGYSLANVTAEIERVGFKIEDTYRVWEVPYHRFWRLRCQK